MRTLLEASCILKSYPTNKKVRLTKIKVADKKKLTCSVEADTLCLFLLRSSWGFAGSEVLATLFSAAISLLVAAFFVLLAGGVTEISFSLKRKIFRLMTNRLPKKKGRTKCKDKKQLT